MQENFGLIFRTLNFSGLWVGPKFVYVLPFAGQKETHDNKIPRKYQENAGTVPGHSREKHFFAFSRAHLKGG